MNALQACIDLIQRDHPSLQLNVDEPLNEQGSWWLDFGNSPIPITVEWKPSIGFGLYCGDDDSFGEGPTEIYTKVETLVLRIRQLFSLEKGLNPALLSLRQIRELRDISQAQLAEKMGKAQPQISRFENQDTVTMETVFALIKGMGGDIEIRAKFEDCDVPLYASRLGEA